MDFELHRGTAFPKVSSCFLSTRVIDSPCRYIKNYFLTIFATEILSISGITVST